MAGHHHDGQGKSTAQYVRHVCLPGYGNHETASNRDDADLQHQPTSLRRHPAPVLTRATRRPERSTLIGCRNEADRDDMAHFCRRRHRWRHEKCVSATLTNCTNDGDIAHLWKQATTWRHVGYFAGNPDENCTNNGKARRACSRSRRAASPDGRTTGRARTTDRLLGGEELHEQRRFRLDYPAHRAGMGAGPSRSWRASAAAAANENNVQYYSFENCRNTGMSREVNKAGCVQNVWAFALKCVRRRSRQRE